MPLLFLRPLYSTTLPGAGDGVDPYWDNVVLLLPMDGAHDASTFTDLKGKAITNGGPVLVKTDVKKYGTASGKFTTNLASFLSTPFVQDFSFPGDFTIECWVYPTQVEVPNDPGSWGRQEIMACGTAYSSSMWLLEWSGYAAASKFTIRWLDASATVQRSVTSASTFALNQWYHVAATRQGTLVTLWVNGVSQGSAVIAQAFTVTGSAGTLTVGKMNYGTTTRNFVGHIDDIRITKGVARYLANFTPPVAAFPSY